MAATLLSNATASPLNATGVVLNASVGLPPDHALHGNSHGRHHVFGHHSRHDAHPHVVVHNDNGLPPNPAYAVLLVYGILVSAGYAP